MSQAKSDNRIDDIWASIEKEPKSGEKQTGTSVVFIGDLSSGKTSLINSFLKPKDVKENTKPTIALDYNFARKAVGNIKVVANFWEIGGDVVEPKLIEVAITRENLGLASAVVVCDLSSPQNVLSSLQRSIAAYKEIISKRADELKATNVNELNEIRQRVTSVYKDHIDTNRVRPTEVPLYIIANKLDAFKTLSLPDRRSISQILRFTAHYHGATLLTVAASLSSAFPDTTTKEIFRKLMDCVAFGQPIKGAYEVNPDKYIYVTKGMDSFEKILLGAGSDSQGSEMDVKVKNRLVSNESEIDLFISNKGVTKDSWKRMAAHLSSLFGEPDPIAMNAAAGKDSMETGGSEAKGGSGGAAADEAAQHQEPEVDDMREVRREALKRYIQEAERKEALLAKMDARGGGSSSSNNN